ncbi:Tyrosine-protein kinase Tec [Leucoagaricus sp. SymC.cos]|nr:Tyrosine-protein kinase Tec [Leucoagaricus sp. SymC.cos]
MSHPNILPLYGVHVTEGAGEKSGARKIWIVSPWMQNGDLLGYSQKHPERAFYLMSDVISGLNYLHKLEIVHGDLRATNVLVSGAGRAILANFEVSRVSMPDPTMSDTAVGEMWWMALELLNDKAIPTRASDIWAFACTCYEVMTGQTPFRHQGMTQASLMSALDKPDSAIPTRPTLRSREEEQLWANLLVRCWKHAPRGRPDTDAIIRYFSKWKSADNTAELDEDSARLWQVNRPESRANVDYELVYRVLLRVNGAV